MGCWRSQADAGGVIQFEETRCRMVFKGQLQIFRASYEPGRVFLNMGGRKIPVRCALKDGLLTLNFGQDDQTFQRIATAPAELDPAPLPLPKPAPLPADKLRAIRAELERRGVQDQAVRTDEAQREKMGGVDADNTAHLIKLVQEVGWVDATRFGAATSNTAFLIVQHSGNLPLMRAALPEIEKDVKAGRLDAQPYALLYDRLQLYLGEKQRFGTQIGQNEQGEAVVLPLEDRARVDEFRKQLGLFPLSTYLGFFKQGGKEVRFSEE
jgi:hypothetical protein